MYMRAAFLLHMPASYCKNISGVFHDREDGEVL